MKNTHVNIPLFIPHLGCPNMCVFCNQRAISGVCSFILETTRHKIESVLETVRGRGICCEIAFFGGSFTGIDRELMINLLNIVQEYVDRGEVSGIRMSTRPDYIDSEIILILKKYTVSAVELGIQSFSDEVLRKCKRGHDSDCSRAAVKLLTNNGFNVVGQMMIGLPGATLSDEIGTALEICSLGASAARIYPTVVFRETELYDMTIRGEYIPLTLDEAVERSSAVFDVFLKHGVDCLRIGLCDSENLHSEETYFAGPNHPAMGELVYGEIYYKKICEIIEKTEGSIPSEITLYVPKGEISKASGHKQRNKYRIKEKYGIKNIVFVESENMAIYTASLS